VGAWDYGSLGPAVAGEDSRLAALIHAVKAELKYGGWATEGLKLEKPVTGHAYKLSVWAFEDAQGLKRTGTIGKHNAGELFRPRIENLEQRHGLPRGALGRKVRLESLFDPVAIGGVDQADRGIAQINIEEFGGFHKVTLAQAYEPEFALSWAARYIVANAERIADEVNVMKAGRASYNVGVEYAKRWLLAGFPADGGPKIGDEDSFARATRYIELIDKQPW
jgi:hypothetical protein